MIHRIDYRWLILYESRDGLHMDYRSLRYGTYKLQVDHIWVVEWVSAEVHMGHR